MYEYGVSDQTNLANYNHDSNDNNDEFQSSVVDSNIDTEIPSQNDSEEFPKLPNIFEHIEVLWPDDATYYAVFVSEIRESGNYVTEYDHVDVQTLHLPDETWRNQSLPANKAIV